MLRKLSRSMLPRYLAAKNKMEKSLIISEVSDLVREQGNFVKRNGLADQWVLAEDLLIREKISAVFRDAMAQNKRSSSHCFMPPKKLISSRAIHEQKPCIAMPSLKYTSLSDILAPLPHLPNPLPTPSHSAPLQAYESQRPSVLEKQQPRMQRSDHSPVTNTTIGKTDLLSIFSLALVDISMDGDDPFEPRPIYEQRFEGNSCA